MTSSLLSKSINSLEYLYENYVDTSSLNKDVRLLLFLRNWFLSIVVFDEKTGNNIEDDLENFLFKVHSVDTDVRKKEYLSRITDHSSAALEHIFNNPREKILREHDIIPIYAVREVDSRTVQWLSRRSGRNIREKLAEKPYLKAIKRRFSLDTTENKLVKAFVYRLEHLLILKEDYQIDEEGLGLLQTSERWLRDDMTKEIGTWSNFPPNNTLLQDKYYRKIWDSWLWIQEIDNLVRKDSQNYKNNFLTSLLWSLVAELNKFQEIRLIQQPIYMDYDDFYIKTHKGIHGILYSKEKTQKIFCEYKNNKVKIHLDHKVLFIGEIENKEQLKVYIGGKIKYYNYSESTLLKIINNFLELVKTEYNLTQLAVVKQKELLGNKIVLDFNSIYPEFIIRGKEKERIPFRFVTQYWKNGEEQVNIDCADANAILLSPEIITISTKNLFSKEILDESAIFSSVLNKFTTEIANNLLTDKLTYLVSDKINEFESEKLRKSMNFSFKDADAIPRSIAGAFYWQSTREFQEQNISPDDMVVVIEASDESISMSKLVAIRDEKLIKIIPDTKGITWERHPSIDLEIVDIKENFEQTLKTTLAKDIAEIWGREGLALDSNNFSWVDDENKWFTADKKYNLKKISVSIKEIQSKLNITKKSNLKILLIGEYADLIDISKELYSLKYTTLEVSDKLLEGAVQLNKWKEEIKGSEIYLWKDHLPELSFNIPQDGRYQDFYLVKKTTIIPQKGNRTEIKIKKLLTLPKNRSFYEFPLQMGSGNQELQFMAYLSSSVLPFAKDMLCELHMTYTYGADDPYELYFIPHNDEDRSIFKSIKVQWKKISEHIIFDSPIPSFPELKDLNSFYAYKTKNNTIDLYDSLSNIVNTLQDLVDYLDFIEGNKSNISSLNIGTVLEVENIIENQQYISKGKIQFENKTIPFYLWKHSDFEINDVVTFQLRKKGKFISAIKLSKGTQIPERYKNILRYEYALYIQRLMQGRRLNDQYPTTFYQDIKDIFDLCESLYKIENDKSLTRAIQFLLASFHDSCPDYIFQDIKVGFEQDPEYYSEFLKFSLGSGDTNSQKTLLSKLLDTPYSINILSFALWREKTLIHTLSKEQLDILIVRIINVLKKFENNLNQGNSIELIRAFEVLYALLRTRESNDKDIQIILAPNQKYTKEIIDSFEKITNKILDLNITVGTRITFNTIEKPAVFNKTPDLLYALRMYLTGDDGANSIHVAEFESE